MTFIEKTVKNEFARLWRECFGKRVTVINDDKPLLAIKNDDIMVYGTPYGGKEGLQTNISAAIAGMIKTMELVKKLSELPVFSLKCTISKEAVEMVYASFKENEQ